jgi:hypothetical protein
MATINISDLRPTGSDLFSDSESYMNELGDSEVHTIHGGSSLDCFAVSVVTRVVQSGLHVSRVLTHITHTTTSIQNSFI